MTRRLIATAATLAAFALMAATAGANSNLVGQWRFDQGAGTVAADTSGFGRQRNNPWARVLDRRAGRRCARVRRRFRQGRRAGCSAARPDERGQRQRLDRAGREPGGIQVRGVEGRQWMHCGLLRPLLGAERRPSVLHIARPRHDLRPVPRCRPVGLGRTVAPGRRHVRRQHNQALRRWGRSRHRYRVPGPDRVPAERLQRLVHRRLSFVRAGELRRRYQRGPCLEHSADSEPGERP